MGSSMCIRSVLLEQELGQRAQGKNEQGLWGVCMCEKPCLVPTINCLLLLQKSLKLSSRGSPTEQTQSKRYPKSF